MNEKQLKSTSKFLSLILRHSPEKIGLQLDENGWADVAALLSKAAQHHHQISMELLKEVVATNDKKRVVFNEDGTKIRANQGHSISVELQLQAEVPPEMLYHGTVSKFIAQIKVQGLQKMSRQHVHLSRDKETATIVGSRRGSAIILSVDAASMQGNGFKFYLSQNGVWLTDHVPPQYINFQKTLSS